MISILISCDTLEGYNYDRPDSKHNNTRLILEIAKLILVEPEYSIDKILDSTVVSLTI